MSLNHPRHEPFLSGLRWLSGARRHEHAAPTPAAAEQTSIEPPLDAMLADPIVQAVMACDGVSEAEVRATVARANLRGNGPRQPARKAR